MSEVLEHVTDEIASLNEAYRLLSHGGKFILTTPHKGLFGFLDPANQKYYIKKIMPGVFDMFVNWKRKKDPNYSEVLSQGIHRHYSVEDFKKLLDKSNWEGNYKILEIKRHGLLLGPLVGNIKAVARNLIGARAAETIFTPFVYLAKVENRIPFGRYSYHIKVLINKLG